jgi:uncharacterized protein (UPF0248 family)
MRSIRDILNEIKWTKDLKQVTVWYIHRGAAGNIKYITGDQIMGIGKSFLQTSNAMIPFHRIVKIVLNSQTVFDRQDITSRDKQL